MAAGQKDGSLMVVAAAATGLPSAGVRDGLPSENLRSMAAEKSVFSVSRTVRPTTNRDTLIKDDLGCYCYLRSIFDI